MLIKVLLNKLRFNKKGFVSIDTVILVGFILILSILTMKLFEESYGNVLNKHIAIIKDDMKLIPEKPIDDNNNSDFPEDEINDWISNKQKYYVGDVVYYNNEKYICLFTHTTNGDMNWAPDTSSNLWARVDQVYDWVPANKTYYIGDIVKFNGEKYICITPHVTNGDLMWAPDNANTLWSQLAKK